MIRNIRPTADVAGQGPSHLNAEGDQPGTPKMGVGFTTLLVLFTAYACAFIYRTSFDVGGIRYFCLFDDAMISMRYAKNLAHGFGMVWNPGGERVEGFTNPLWVLYMALFHLFPISPPRISLLIQISCVGCLLLTLEYVRRIVSLLAPGSKVAKFSSTALVAFYIPLVNWSLQGMEVGLLALLVVMCVWMALRGMESGRVPLQLYVVLGAMTMVRIDTAGIGFLLLVCLAVVDSANRRKHVVLGGSFLVAALVIQTAARWAYFGEIFPNTYYLKMTGFSLVHRLQRGGGTFLDFASGMTWIVFLLPFTVLLLRRDVKILMLAILFIAQCGYSVFVGGDAWEWWGGSNRYISIAMPLFFVLFGCALGSLKSAWEKLAPRKPRLMRVASGAIVCLVIMFSYFRLNNVKGAVQLSDWMSAANRLVSTAGGGRPGVSMAEISDMASWLLVPMPLEYFENSRMVRASVLVDSITAPGAVVAVTLAGTLPYFSNRSFVDLLGKNDKRIAKMEGRTITDPGGRVSYTPGHSKWDYSYSIGFLKPDVVAQLWEKADEARPYLEAEYQAAGIEDRTWYLRRGSPHVRWETVQRITNDASAPAR